MAKPVKWSGSNRRLGPPEGITEEQCGVLYTFSNGACSVSCWELSPEEIAEVTRTGRIFISVWSGWSQPPIFIGSETITHQVVADFGAVWKMSTPEVDINDGHSQNS